MSENMHQDAWEYAYNELREEFKNSDKENEFTLWFNMKYVSATIDEITVSVSNNFLLNQMKTRGSFDIMQNKIRSVTGHDKIILKCIVEKTKQETKSEQNETIKIKTEKSETETKKDSQKKNKHPLLKEESTFENFIPGENCRFAYNAALAVAKNPGKKYNPVLFYGNSGVGKTHLMQAIGNYIYHNNEEKLKICYVGAETFTNEFTSSIVSKSTDKFKNKYRDFDVLLLDDIHFLQNKPGIQEELFYTFNALYENKAQMVFTCDRPINEIKGMAERLVSRLSNGLVIDMQPPNYETRYAILQKKISTMEIDVNADVIDFIAKNIETNVRDLEQALTKIAGYAELIGKEVTLEIAQDLLKDIFETSVPVKISIETIQKVVSDNYNISVNDIKSKRRDKKLTIPRQIAMYLSRTIGDFGYNEIGNEFGKKDHTTVMYACSKIENEIKTDSIMSSKINNLIKEIKEYKK